MSQWLCVVTHRPRCLVSVRQKVFKKISNIKAGDTSAGDFSLWDEVSRVDPRVAIHCIPLSTLLQ